MDSPVEHYDPLLGKDLEAPAKKRWSILRADKSWEKGELSRFKNKLALSCSLILNTLLLSLGTYLYRRGGPSNPIFPQALYCM